MPSGSPLSRRLTLWLALGGLALLVFLVMRPFFAPLAWAGILAYMTWPIAARIRIACRGRDTLAAALATLLAGLILFGPLLWLVWVAQKELGQIYPLLQEFIAEPPPLPPWLEKIPWLGEWVAQLRIEMLTDPQDVITNLKDWLRDHSRQAAALAGGAGKNLVKLAMVMLILFFFYRDGARIMRELGHVLSEFLGPRVHGYLAAAGATTRAVVYGILLTALVQGILAGMGYGVAGLSSPVTLGVFTAMVALIPFGTPLAWGSAGAWLLFQGEIGPALGLWAWGGLVVSQMDNLLRPLFISSISTIPFLLILFGVLGGLLAFGLVGLFAGPIVLAVAWAVWREWAANLDEAENGEENPPPPAEV